MTEHRHQGVGNPTTPPEERDGLTRRSFLTKTAVAGGAIAGSGIVATGARASRRRARASDTLYVAQFGDLQNLDVHTSSTDLITGEALTNLYSIPATFKAPAFTKNGIKYADVNNFQGQAANQWKWNPKKTVVDFTLRADAKFPDGTPLTANDVKKSFDRAFDVKAVGVYLFTMAGLTSKSQVQAIDTHRFRVTLPKPSSLLFGNMAMFYGSAIINQKLIAPHESKSDPTAQGWLKTNTAPSGAFTLQNWNVGSGWTLEANPDMWEPYKPKTKSVVFQIVPDAQQRELLLKSGKIDFALGIPVKDVPNLRKDPNLNIVSIPSRAIAYAGFNITDKPFDNKLVRQAFSYAIPYQTIMQQVLHGQGIQLKGPVPAGTPGSDFSFWHYNTDYVKAKRLLAQAGYKNGFDTELAIPVGNPVDEQTAQWIQQGLQRIGVHVSINKMPSAAFTAQLQGKQHKFWFSSSSWISINNDPFYHLYWLFRADCCTYGHYQRPDVVKAVDKWINESPTNPGRLAALKQIQKTIVDDAPWIFLFQPPHIYGMRKNVKGFVYYSSEGFVRYNDLYKT